MLKLMRWAILVFFPMGSPVQFAASVLLSMVELSIQLVFNPFAKDEVNTLQLVQLSLGFVTSLISLCLRYISALLESTRITPWDISAYHGYRNFLSVIMFLLTLFANLFFAYKIGMKMYEKANDTESIRQHLSSVGNKLNVRLNCMKTKVGSFLKNTPSQQQLEMQNQNSAQSNEIMVVPNPVHRNPVKVATNADRPKFCVKCGAPLDTACTFCEQCGNQAV